MNEISAEDQARVDAIEAALLARWPENRIAPTLERISALVDALGEPQLSYPTIHIGGTNGKTTTSRMIDSLLFSMGLRTGRFTSPHLETYRERLASNGEPIDPIELIKTTECSLILSLLSLRNFAFMISLKFKTRLSLVCDLTDLFKMSLSHQIKFLASLETLGEPKRSSK